MNKTKLERFKNLILEKLIGLDEYDQNQLAEAMADTYKLSDHFTELENGMYLIEEMECLANTLSMHLDTAIRWNNGNSNNAVQIELISFLGAEELFEKATK